MSGETPTNTGFDPQTITGEGGVFVSGAGHVKVELTSDRFLPQTEWHINALTGSNRNSGLTAATAIRTWAELRRRLGHGPITHQTVVNIDSDLTENIIIDFELEVGLAAGLIVQGQRTVLRSGTLTNVTPYDAPTNVVGSLGDAALPGSWTAEGLVGKLMVLTGRPVSDPLIGPPTGFIAKDLGVVLGVQTARFSPTLDIVTFAGNTPTDPLVGDAYSVVDLTKIHGFVRCQTTGGSGLLIQNLEIDGVNDEPNGSQSLTHQSGFMFPVNCVFSGAGDVLVVGGIVENDFSVCRFKNQLLAESGQTFCEGTLHEGRLTAIDPECRLTVANPCLRQGDAAGGSVGITSRRGALLDVQAPLAVCDVDVGASCAPGSQVDLEDILFGTGVALVGVEVDSYGVVFFDPALAPSMTPTATSQVLVGSTPKTYGTIPFIEAATNAGVVIKQGY